jgi:predicted RNase H-like HicB family nuclease
MTLSLNIEIEHENDGRWIAEVVDVPGALAYGADMQSAVRGAKAIALSVLSDRARSEEIDSIQFTQPAL